MTNADRSAIFNQSHRQYVDPRFLAKRVVPFVIEQVSRHPMPMKDGMAQHVAMTGSRDEGRSGQ